MAQTAAKEPEISRQAHAVIRALTIGLRAWSLYPPEHPALGLGIDRLTAALTDATSDGALLMAVTPQTLVIDGVSVESPDVVVAECAGILHDLDILQISFVAPPPAAAVRALLDTLGTDRRDRRARGGPAAIWENNGHPSITIEQIDYQELLEREGEEGPARRDPLWKSIVRSIVAGRRTFTEAEQQRLLEISHEAWAIGELADDCKGAYCGADGSPLLTTQAATVLAVYRHIAGTVGVLEPERQQEVLNNFALATSALDPTLALEVLRQQDGPDAQQPIMAALKQAFDEQQIAMLLARALARAGEATNRLSQMLDTMAPDEERRRRVLRLADKLLTERDFGANRPITDIRNSLEELLLKYDESPYVSAAYRESMDNAAGRAAELASRDLPPELSEWLETLNHESVRGLSGQLLIDLLTIETSPERAAEIARDMGNFAEDLVLGGAYAEARRIVETLRTAARPGGIARDAAAKALDGVGRSHGMTDAVTLLGELPEKDAGVVADLCASIGPVVVPALLTVFTREDGSAQTARVSAILVAMGPAAIPELSHGLDGRKPWAQYEIARVLGAIGTAAAVPPLQVLMRRADPRVLKAVIPALSGIDDPSAVRALHTVLRAATGTARESVVQSLIAMRDARVVPMLTRILDESDALGKDFDLVVESLAAVATFQDDRAVKPIAAIARQRRWLAWGQTRRLRRAAIEALVSIGSPAARGTVETLEKTGDWQLRRLARAILTTGPGGR